MIDASTAASLPALALELVEPGKRVVYIGIYSTPSTIDTRTMLLKDVTAVGVLSGSLALADVVEAYADGLVDPRPLVAATVGLAAFAVAWPLSGLPLDVLQPLPYRMVTEAVDWLRAHPAN